MTGWIRDGSDDSWWRGQPRRQGDSPRQEPSAPPAKPIQRAREPIEDAVPYQNTPCPQCGTLDTRVQTTRRPIPALTYRYHICDKCGCKFKSCHEEKLEHE